MEKVTQSQFDKDLAEKGKARVQVQTSDPNLPGVILIKEQIVTLPPEKAKAKDKPKAAEKPAEKPKGRTKRARGEGPTKQDKAVEIFKRLNGDKGQTIVAIQAELGMSQAGATTYFYNSKRIVSKQK